MEEDDVERINDTNKIRPSKAHLDQSFQCVGYLNKVHGHTTTSTPFHC